MYLLAAAEEVDPQGGQHEGVEQYKPGEGHHGLELRVAPPLAQTVDFAGDGVVITAGEH